MRLLAILLFCLSVSASTAQLPEVTTTFNQSNLDVNNGIENEGWFLTNNGEYKCRFRNTLDGVNHAFVKLAWLMIKYNGKVSNFDYSNLQKLPRKLDETLDYDELVKVTHNKDKDFYISRRFRMLTGPFREIEINNIEGREIPFWTIRAIRAK
jgi:hypothetical protein